jgi:hypothetical protein
MNLSDVPKQNPDTAARVIDGLAYVIDPVTSELHSFNETATRAWELADGSRTVEAIVGAIAAEYDADKPVVEREILELFSGLAEKNLILI